MIKTMSQTQNTEQDRSRMKMDRGISPENEITLEGGQPSDKKNQYDVKSPPPGIK